ncbi:TonB-dependent receptor [Sphingobium lactosutens]|uniref:TonB-dependent receptor n=1 Tax=Sphingobium lactosutens TaxID=522773 RepID=UPI0015BD7D33|nr:TonB-dependent receptor [Sphingobium lactosutens]NWK94573.1 TonB-dependent receptor [Sphingobium lactosutens]
MGKSSISKASTVKCGTALVCIAWSSLAFGQSVDLPASQGADVPAANIVVTGFRSSLTKALTAKREDAGVIDTILAEDIGKFPDSNLAESMQRVPGVALARGDGGEGKNISVRGLGAAFTKVRLNGMEGSSQTGSSDIYGAGNRGRSFDFNVFASELFSALTVRKTSAADIEEGSLGATVDLKTAGPLDYNQDFVLTARVQGSWNEIRDEVDPRASMLVSKKFADGRLGVLGSVAYTRRRTREMGYSGVNILRASDDGGFCSPLGGSPQVPANNAAKGVTAANCGTGVPRTSVASAYNAVFSRPGIAGGSAPGVAGGGTYHPRIPRYVNSEQDYDRLGATASLQWEPRDGTRISLDGLLAIFDVERRDNFISGLSFGRNLTNNGKPMTSIVDASVTRDGTLEYGKFNGVDVRSENQTDRFKSTFKQLTLNLEHEFSDAFKIYGLVGKSSSIFNNPIRTTVNIDAINQNGFSYDFRDRGNIPLIDFGFDITNPAAFAFTGTAADGTVRGTVVTRRLRSKIDNGTAELNGLWSVAEGFKLRFGGQFRETDFRVVSFSRTAANNIAVPAFPAGKSLADVTRQITGFGKGLGAGVPSSWVAVDYDKFNDLFDTEARQGIFADCSVECGVVNDNSAIRERISVGYGQAEFDTGDLLPFVIRGNAGLRYVRTAQRSIGYIPIATPAGSPFPQTGREVTIRRSYEDWLPSVNIAMEFSDKLILRLAAADVLSRPELSNLTPGGSVNTTTRTISNGNALLKPIRSSTYDASLEWYFASGALLSVGYFRKDISSYIQVLNNSVVYSDTGLPASLLDGSPSSPSDIFTVSQVVNTPGGPLDGFEINYQQPFKFLPGFLSNLGLLANYTRVQSKITYFLNSSGGVPTQTTVNDLLGLSKNAASGTLYYEDSKFSIRGTLSYRGPYIRAIPSGGPDSDIIGNKSNVYVDASASYQLTDRIQFTVEAQNLTDERNTLFIDSQRQDPLFETRIGRTVTVGASFKF